MALGGSQRARSICKISGIRRVKEGKVNMQKKVVHICIYNSQQLETKKNFLVKFTVGPGMGANLSKYMQDVLKICSK